MRIAQISPLTEAVPPKLYGGTERVISWLTEELVGLGHDVTLFASGDSCTSARLEAIWPRALRLDSSIRDPYCLHITMLEQVRRRAEDFDVLHFHLDYFPFSLFSRQPTPPRFTRASAGIHDVLVSAADFDIELAAPAGAAGRMGEDDLSWRARATAVTAAGETELSCISRPHFPGEMRRPCDQYRAVRRIADKNCSQD